MEDYSLSFEDFDPDSNEQHLEYEAFIDFCEENDLTPTDIEAWEMFEDYVAENEEVDGLTAYPISE